jgi:hypothetical protein
MTGGNIEPELAFVVGCCRSAFAAAPSQSPENGALDWGRVLRLARFHRVQGLVSHSIRGGHADVPKATAEQLFDDASSIASSNLRAAAECAELLQSFERRGIPLLFVKGLTLAKLAYGTIVTKSAVDIDLLIASCDLDETAALLRERGYRLVEPRDERALGRAHVLRKESNWHRAEPPLQIDLHTRLADNARLIPAIGIESPRNIVEVAQGITLPTLARDELFAYLAVHGASSAWFRLKWITDFAALLSREPVEQIPRLCRRSLELGAGRATAQALMLADTLYGTLERLPDLKEELFEDAVTRWLYSAAWQLLRRNEPVEPTARPFGTLPIHLTQLGLLHGWHFPLAEAVRQARAALA